MREDAYDRASLLIGHLTQQEDELEVFELARQQNNANLQGEYRFSIGTSGDVFKVPGGERTVAQGSASPITSTIGSTFVLQRANRQNSVAGAPAKVARTQAFAPGKLTVSG